MFSGGPFANHPDSDHDRSRVEWAMQTELTSIPSSAPSHDEIALRAHQIWLEQGCPHGHDVDNWLEAERQLVSEYANRSVDREVDSALIPSAEDVSSPGRITARGSESEDVNISTSDSTHRAFEEDAPLATKVEEQTISSGRPDSRQSPTSLEL